MCIHMCGGDEEMCDNLDVHTYNEDSWDDLDSNDILFEGEWSNIIK